MNKHNITSLSANLPVTLLEQEDCVVAYTPALDISSYGSNEKEAIANFRELVGIFFSELRDKRQLDTVLLSLGWAKQNSHWQPPKITQKNIEVQTEAFA